MKVIFYRRSVVNIISACMYVQKKLEKLKKGGDNYRLIHGLFHIALVISTRP